MEALGKKIFFVSVFLSQLFTAKLAPIEVKEPCSVKPAKDVRPIQNKRFDILVNINSTQNNPNGNIYKLDHKIRITGFKAQNKKPLCPVVEHKDYKESRRPKLIKYVTLANSSDKGHCLPVLQKITYLERNPKCDKRLNKMLYSLNERWYIVGYEAWK